MCSQAIVSSDPWRDHCLPEQEVCGCCLRVHVPLINIGQLFTVYVGDCWMTMAHSLVLSILMASFRERERERER